MTSGRTKKIKRNSSKERAQAKALALHVDGCFECYDQFWPNPFTKVFLGDEDAMEVVHPNDLTCEKGRMLAEPFTEEIEEYLNAQDEAA